MPYLPDRRAEFGGVSRIHEAILVITTKQPDVDIVVFTSCVKQPNGKWITRDAGEDRLRICFRRRGEQPSLDQWSRIQHFNRTKNTIPSAANIIKESMHGNASSWTTLESALAATVEDVDHEVGRSPTLDGSIARPQRPVVEASAQMNTLQVSPRQPSHVHVAQVTSTNHAHVQEPAVLMAGEQSVANRSWWQRFCDWLLQMVRR